MYQTMQQVQGSIPPGKASTFRMNIGPVTDPNIAKGIKIEVVSAQVL
jgi:hypothetical protein